MSACPARVGQLGCQMDELCHQQAPRLHAAVVPGTTGKDTAADGLACFAAGAPALALVLTIYNQQRLVPHAGTFDVPAHQDGVLVWWWSR